ncbi:MAG: hypothetical protein V1859_02065 [archaeon]
MTNHNGPAYYIGNNIPRAVDWHGRILILHAVAATPANAFVGYDYMLHRGKCDALRVRSKAYYDAFNPPGICSVCASDKLTIYDTQKDIADIESAALLGTATICSEFFTLCSVEAYGFLGNTDYGFKAGYIRGGSLEEMIVSLRTARTSIDSAPFWEICRSVTGYGQD